MKHDVEVDSPISKFEVACDRARHVSGAKLIVQVRGAEDYEGEIAEAGLLCELHADFLDLIQSVRSGRPVTRSIRKGE